MDRPYRVVANWIVDYEQLYYLVIVVAGLILAGLGAFVGRKIRKKRPETEDAPAARTYCMFCGAEIDPDAKFCSKCGKSQVSSG
jgi:ribosomal protein L40E